MLRILPLYFLFILAGTPLTATQALAAVPLLYKSQTADVRERSILSYLESEQYRQTSDPYSIAAVDMNGDGVDEWIVRLEKPGCEAEASCAYVLTALKSGSPAVLGVFLAGKIGIANEKQYGVRKVLVYNDKNNDFAHQIFVWTPANGSFEPQ